jgi:hypothetical protein
MMSDYQQREVDWYRKHGKHPARIVLDLDRNPYVVGDWSWNAESRPHESIEFEMLRELGPGEEK